MQEELWKVDGKEEHFLLHESKEEDENERVFITVQRWTEQFNMVNRARRHRCGSRGVMNKEMKYLNDIMHGMEPDDEFRPLLTG